MSSVTNGMVELSIFGSFIGIIIGGLAIGLPLALNGHNVLNCFLGGEIGGAACGAFLGGTAPLVAAKVRQHMDQKNLVPNDVGISDSDL